MAKKKHSFVPREISWLSFNGRVLQEAADPRNPLLERLKFLGIFSNNLDEFFRVRVATLSRIARLEKKHDISSEASPQKLIRKISEIVARQQEQVLVIYEEILLLLEEQNIFIVGDKELTPSQGACVKEYYHNELRSHLFPIMLRNLEDPSSLRDKSPYLAVHMHGSRKKKKDNYALIEIPEVISRFLILPEISGKRFIIFTDDIIRYCLREIFSMFDYEGLDAYTIKFTRDAELDIDTDVSKSFLELMSESLKQRKLGRPIRFIYDEQMPRKFLDMLTAMLKVSRNAAILPGGRYHNFRDFMNFPVIGVSELRYPPAPPLPHPDLLAASSMFPIIRKKDVMLHFPYQSFRYIIDLLREASIDPDVTAVKITIYRVARNSNVMSALINAARNGKKVTVLMELQARFDEQNNIYWTEKLQEEGVHIIQSRSGFKVHAKLILISRKEGKKLVNYANVGTGNFNEDTAGVYADESLLTANPAITGEVEKLFDLIELQYKSFKFRNLVISPYNMRDHFIRLLTNEIRNASSGKEAWAVIKINNLVDEKIAARIYEAARAGVRIQLIIRGTCILVPDPEDYGGKLEAISIVDKYLEHSRIFVFCNGGKPLYYLSSADWMVRNFDYRVEVACPVLDKRLQDELWHMLQIQLSDNTKARIIGKGQKNIYVAHEDKPELRSQTELYNYFAGQTGKK
jgi:polyphosphate kinase